MDDWVPVEGGGKREMDRDKVASTTSKVMSRSSPPGASHYMNLLN